jgi:hypothetical protein
MDKDWRDELAARFPELCGTYKGDPRKTCMAWGFCIGDGWKDLFTELLEKMDKLDPKPELAQVKEKFGGLRVYLEKWNEDAEELIREAEKKAAKTCDWCGAPGKIDPKSAWARCRCEKHKDKTWRDKT